MINFDTIKFSFRLTAYIYLACTLILFQNGFYIYHITPFLWEKTSATVESEDKYMIEIRGNSKYETLNQAEVSFYVDEQLHHGLVPLSYQEKCGDVINIARLKSNPNICIRSEWLPLDVSVKIINLFFLIILGVDWAIHIHKKDKELKRGSIVNVSSNEE